MSNPPCTEKIPLRERVPKKQNCDAACLLGMLGCLKQGADNDCAKKLAALNSYILTLIQKQENNLITCQEMLSTSLLKMDVATLLTPRLTST